MNVDIGKFKAKKDDGALDLEGVLTYQRACVAFLDLVSPPRRPSLSLHLTDWEESLWKEDIWQ